MLIAGAGGHAMELMDVFRQGNLSEEICFFDDLSPAGKQTVPAGYRVLSTLEEAAAYFKTHPYFALGVGKPAVRKAMAEKLLGAGGKLASVISPHAIIGKEGVDLGEGLNIMTGAVITQRAKIGRGALIHIHCSIHHDSIIGEYCELSPGCRVLGGVELGALVSIGSNAVILPGVKIGAHARIGAGAVVTKDVEQGATMAGVPARKLHR